MVPCSINQCLLISLCCLRFITSPAFPCPILFFKALGEKFFFIILILLVRVNAGADSPEWAIYSETDVDTTQNKKKGKKYRARSYNKYPQCFRYTKILWSQREFSSCTLIPWSVAEILTLCLHHSSYAFSESCICWHITLCFLSTSWRGFGLFWTTSQIHKPNCYTDLYFCGNIAHAGMSDLLGII